MDELIGYSNDEFEEAKRLSESDRTTIEWQLNRIAKGIPTCPKCQRGNVVKGGKRIKKGGQVQGYACKKCGHRFIKLSA